MRWNVFPAANAMAELCMKFHNHVADHFSMAEIQTPLWNFPKRRDTKFPGFWPRRCSWVLRRPIGAGQFGVVSQADAAAERALLTWDDKRGAQPRRRRNNQNLLVNQPKPFAGRKIAVLGKGKTNRSVGCPSGGHAMPLQKGSLPIRWGGRERRGS